MGVAAVDIGGTKVLGAVVDERGQILERNTIPTDTKAGTRNIIEALRSVIGERDVVAVGAAVAAYVSHPEGRVVFSPNLDYDRPDVLSAISEALSLPATVENDANAAAWGEFAFGAARGIQHFVMLTLGTGIGGGIIMGGELYRGAGGFAAEFGHMTLLEEGPECACGERGCFEALASGNAIGRMAREAIVSAGVSPLIATAGGDAANITGGMVGSAAQEGDEFARLILARAGKWLGVGCTNLANLFDPEVIVIGGGVADLGDLIIEPARRELTKRLGHRRPPPRLVAAGLGGDAGVIGVADLARRSIR